MDVTAARQAMKVLLEPYAGNRDKTAREEALQVLRSINDLEALQELIQVYPKLLTLESPSEGLCPPLVEAVKRGRLEIIRALLKHRVTMPPEQLVPPLYHQYEDNGFRGHWGTPLTTACMLGRHDIVRMLSDGTPDVDINEVDYDGYTPFLSAARGIADETEAQTRDRLAILRLLMDRGADVHAVKADSLRNSETLDKEFDEGLVHRPFVFRPRPGGLGNALSLAMEVVELNTSILQFLVKEAGVNVFKASLRTYQHFAYDHAFITPLGVGARYGNIKGVETLLSLFPDAEDHIRLLATTDATIVPEPRPAQQSPEDEMPVLFPLHAALLGKQKFRAPWGADDVLTTNETIRAATINAAYRQHYTPLHMVTSFDRIPLLLEVVKLGADLDTPAWMATD
ncbi:hypothetical protein Sste5346_009153 [Sporothrix stenoceras]|uniref:Ankyrin repeat protein n=1 Tax=Sporothrix stenoceras TaxID=5173 RepID=A0ABR3YL74_9PEZI